jgi:hypothetical protein
MHCFLSALQVRCWPAYFFFEHLGQYRCPVCRGCHRVPDRHPEFPYQRVYHAHPPHGQLPHVRLLEYTHTEVSAGRVRAFPGLRDGRGAQPADVKMGAPVLFPHDRKAGGCCDVCTDRGILRDRIVCTVMNHWHLYSLSGDGNFIVWDENLEPIQRLNSAGSQTGWMS